jgi:hypothetical protein
MADEPLAPVTPVAPVWRVCLAKPAGHPEGRSLSETWAQPLQLAKQAATRLDSEDRKALIAPRRHGAHLLQQAAHEVARRRTMFSASIVALDEIGRW